LRIDSSISPVSPYRPFCRGSRPEAEAGPYLAALARFA
jgi:hypothetical protein